MQYAKRVIGQRMTQGGQTYLPLKVNMAGVIPVIFAASMMAIPPTIGQLIGQNKSTASATSLATFFSPGSWHYVVGECILIILFTYFYTAIIFNPVDQAENLKSTGVHPGHQTRAAYRRIPGPSIRPAHFPGRLIPGVHRRAAYAPDRPDGRQLRLRRHLHPDRHRGRARHDETAGGAADDAQLRGLPQVTLGRALSAHGLPQRPPRDPAMAAAGRLLRPENRTLLSNLRIEAAVCVF